ncbi:MAG: DUF5069 domain-containing protein [Armatimonadetes bacterium]|nr:DUF5069 domain-containing protein [Akkermansiaceae bacterium]
MSHKIVPTISSGVAGPLGVLHMPRLWQKLSLEAAGKLAEGYPGCGQGYDQMLLDGIGLDKDATLGFVSSKKPTYVEFEAFVCETATMLNETAVSSLNAAIIGYQHAAETRQSILSSVGLPDGKPTDAINLNNLDDWQAFHSAELK